MSKQKINNRNDWSNFALGYLALAELACTELVEKKYHGGDHEEDFNIETLYIPALFNFKHGIEIFLKALGIEFLNKEVLNQSDYSHDIEEIFSRIKKEISVERIKKADEKYKNKNPEDKSDLKGNLIFTELENLIKKYQNLDFLKEKIGTDYLIRDWDNTVFKYPTNSLNIQLNYEKISSRFTEKDAIKLLTDILMLINILLRFRILLSAEKI